MTKLRVREYGDTGPLVIALHGGPAAPGEMAPIARELSRSFRVLEPFQRGSGDEPLTVARHIADLHDLVASLAGEPPTLVGYSWGAMLALAFAAAHPSTVASLALIGCGTFDKAARAQLQTIIHERMDDDLRQRLEGLQEIPDPDRRLQEMGSLIEPIYLYDPIPDEDESEPVDARAHHETWDDMVRLQEEGVYPAAFSAIDAPAIMLHGAYDPHPGRMIHAGLKAHIPQIEYREWERCGHSPWREKAVSGEFYRVLENWLARPL